MSLEFNAQNSMSAGRLRPRLGENDNLGLLSEAGLWREAEPLRLHLGCGEQRFAGFVNIDYPPEHHQVMQIAADAYANILKLNFPAGSVDEIRLHHVFEHFNRVTALAMLIKWHGWLKVGGRLLIETPDLMGSATNLISPNASWKTRMGAARHLAGDQADSWAYHLDHWFPERFERTLTRLGFEAVKTSTTSWSQEPFLANVEVAAEKAARSGNQLLEAAEALLWESTVAEAERPTFEVWRRQLGAILKGEAQEQPVNAVAPKVSPSVVAVIFSKDRPLQLDALLRSLAVHCRDLRSARVRVIYTTSEAAIEPLYEQVAREHGWARLIRERDFKTDLLAQTGSSEFVLFLVDDTLFVRGFALTEIVAALAGEPGALAFSLRLGRNTNYCYSFDRAQKLPEFTPVRANMLKFKWVGADLDFGYPLELSSSVYRTQDLAPLLARTEFSNPNTLEGGLATQAASREAQPFLICFAESAAFSAPLNRVQSVNQNRAGANPACAPEVLCQKFSEGQRVDVAALAGFVPQACHQEVELKTLPARNGEPLVSVVIPCYNQGQYLPDAVASVRAQSYAAWEIFIVNDGSQDNTSEVARQLATDAPNLRIRLIEQANRGLAEARNAGIRASSGRYILPLDADDKIAPAMLEKAVSCLEADPSIAIVYTDALYFGSASHEQTTRDFDFDDLCAHNFLNYCSLFRREIWDQVGGYNSNMIWGYEDWDFWIGCGAAGFQAKHLAEPLFHYRVKAESMFTRALKHDLELRAQIVLNHPQLYNEATRKWARLILDTAGAAEVESNPSPAHEILRRADVLADLQKQSSLFRAEYLAHSELLTRHRELETRHRELEIRHRDLEARHRDLEARHRDLEINHCELEVRHADLQQRFEGFQSALNYATAGGIPPEWMRLCFEKTLGRKLRASIRKRLTTLRRLFDDPATT